MSYFHLEEHHRRERRVQGVVSALAGTLGGPWGWTDRPPDEGVALRGMAEQIVAAIERADGEVDEL